MTKAKQAGPKTVMQEIPQRAGKLADEYEIYKTHAEAMGWQVKSFDEWLNS